MHSKLLAAAAVGIMAAVLSTGCQPAAKTDSGLAKMVTELTEFHDTIKTGLESGDVAGNNSAHGALHGVFDVLQNLSAAGSETGLSAADRDKMHAAAEAMAGVYAKIDAAQHKPDFAVGSIDYTEYSEPLSEALTTLKSFCK